MYRARVVVPVPERLFLYIRIAPQWRLGSASEPRPGPRSPHNEHPPRRLRDDPPVRAVVAKVAEVMDGGDGFSDLRQ